MHAQFPVEDMLSSEPVELSKSAGNNRAIAHTIRLSTLYDPKSQVAGFKRISILGLESNAQRPDTYTFGVGEEHTLQAGALLHIPEAPSGAFMPMRYRIPRIAHLFLLPEAHEAGRLLVASAIDKVIEQGLPGITTSVRSDDTERHALFESLGFKDISSPKGSQGSRDIGMGLGPLLPASNNSAIMETR